MKKKLLAIMVLSFMTISTVAPIIGADKDNITETETKISTTKEVPTMCGISNVIFEEDLSIKKITEEQWEKKSKHKGWIVNDYVPVMSEPSENSEMIDKYMFNDKIVYRPYNEKWCSIEIYHPYINENGIQISVKKIVGYIDIKHISEASNACKTYDIPKNKGFKSYMSYTTISDKNSKQYKLQEYAYTGKYGLRQVNERYCVAVGTHFSMDVGTYFDLVLENGEVIPCVVGDIKSQEHTLRDRITTALNGCVSEFIVETRYLPYKVKNNDFTGTGDISDCYIGWDSPVTKIIVYDYKLGGF